MTIGRSSSCEIVISDARVSREHARITERGQAWVISDLGTSNGTFFEGQRITEAELRDGGHIRVAATMMTFCLDDAPAQLTPEATTIVEGASATVCAAIESGTLTPAQAVAAQGSPGRMVRAVEAIETVSRALQGVRTPDDLFAGVTQAIMKAYPDCECCHVLTWDDSDQALTPRASSGRDGRPRRELSLSSTAVHRTMEKREAVVCVSTETEPGLAEARSVRTLGIRSFACAPCEQTSGDYYDFIELDDARWGVAVGDVSGHGIPSALLMMSARSLLRASLSTHPDMTDLFSHINALVVNDVRDGRFMSLLYAIIDPASSTIHYLNAGHEP